MGKFQGIADRENVPIYEKEKPKPTGSHLVKYKKEVLYKYYKCDYCGAEIRILDKKQEMKGGIAIMPHTLTRRGELKLALCNECLNPAINEFEKEEV